jgi:hypothetical protein
MSVEDLQRKLLSRLNPNTNIPTPCQIERQIRENNIKNLMIHRFQEEVGIENLHPSLVEIYNRGPVFLANFKSSLESIKKRPDGEILIPLIEITDVRKDGSVKIKNLKKKI